MLKCVRVSEWVNARLRGHAFLSNANMNATDSNSSDIFSLRIVSIDNYMRAPVLGSDTCYSEFRAEAVKQVSKRYVTFWFLFSWVCFHDTIVSIVCIGPGHSCVWYRFKWYKNLCTYPWCLSVFVCSICWRWIDKWNWSFNISIGNEFR